jgi:uncharacterized membrane protein YuzA (DUF378 family)
MLMRLNIIDYIALILLVVGGLNWGLIGFFNFDLVAAIFGNMTAISRTVYGIVGICAIYTLYIIYKISEKR